MKRSAALFALCSSLLPACAPYSNVPLEEDRQFLAALPQGGDLEQVIPFSQLAEQTVGAEGLGVGAEGLVRGVQLARGLSGVLAQTLEVLDQVVAQPPDLRGTDCRAWGPIALPREDETLWGTVLVQRREDGVLLWQGLLSRDEAEPESCVPEAAGDGSISAFWGWFRPTGSAAWDFAPEGGLGLNMAAWASIDVSLAGSRGLVRGVFAVGEDRLLQLSAEDLWGPFREELPAIDGVTLYRENSDGIGSFVYSTQTDLARSDTPRPERLDVVSRWGPAGRGRADGYVSGGDLGDEVALLGECWDEQGLRTWYRQGWNDVEQGDAEGCAFSRRLLPDDAEVGHGIEEPLDLPGR